MREKLEMLAFAGAALGAVVFFSWLIGITVFVIVVEAHCTRLGWREATATYDFGGYCSTRDNQTDIVVPWREAKQR